MNQAWSRHTIRPQIATESLFERARRDHVQWRRPQLRRGADGAACTLGGKPLPLAPIAVEKISGPVLGFAGGKDEVWSAAAYARSIADRARTRG
jgi:hypothetical protein